MNLLMNPVGSKAEGKLNCINAVVITQKTLEVQGFQGFSFFRIGINPQFVEYLWNEDQINGAVVIFLKVIYINIIIDYCVQRQVDLIYMTPEYMAELHKFIYMSKDSDVDRLK